MNGSYLREACFLLGIAVTERQASFVLADPVLAVGYATAETFVIVLEFLYAPLLTIEECPPGRFRFSAMEANEIGHELPSLRVRCLWVYNERGFECCLRALPFFTLVLPIVL